VKILITGAFGQDGTILSQQLTDASHNVVGSYFLGLDDPQAHPFLEPDNLIALDVTSESQVKDSLAKVSPEVVIHLAGETSVASSWINPARTMISNVIGTTFFLEWIKNNDPDIHFINATSVEVFDDNESVVSELSPMKAKNPYGVSKLATAQLVSALRAEGLRLTNAFLSNHESKYRPEKFVMGKIARGVAAIADGKQEALTLGDISITRDWSSADDVCRGIKLMVEKQFVGDMILASGTNHKLSEIVKLAFASVGISNWQDYVQSDDSLLRTNDERLVTFDVSLAKTRLDWSVKESSAVWISEMVAGFRE
jgi:GDPmannose 4,6-dehydratase